MWSTLCTSRIHGIVSSQSRGPRASAGAAIKRPTTQPATTAKAIRLKRNALIITLFPGRPSCNGRTVKRSLNSSEKGHHSGIGAVLHSNLRSCRPFKTDCLSAESSFIFDPLRAGDSCHDKDISDKMLRRPSQHTTAIIYIRNSLVSFEIVQPEADSLDCEEMHVEVSPQIRAA